MRATMRFMTDASRKRIRRRPALVAAAMTLSAMLPPALVAPSAAAQAVSAADTAFVVDKDGAQWGRREVILSIVLAPRPACASSVQVHGEDRVATAQWFRKSLALRDAQVPRRHGRRPAPRQHRRGGGRRPGRPGKRAAPTSPALLNRLWSHCEGEIPGPPGWATRPRRLTLGVVTGRPRRAVLG